MNSPQVATQLVRFALVGVLNTAIDLGLFALLTYNVGLDPLLANVFSFTAGAANSFVLNKYWTFGAGGGGRETVAQATRFTFVTVIVWALHEGMLVLFHKGLGWPALPVKALAIGVGLGVGFVANKFWAFATHSTN